MTLYNKRVSVFHNICSANITRHHPKTALALRSALHLSGPLPSGNGPTPCGVPAAPKCSRKQAIELLQTLLARCQSSVRERRRIFQGDRISGQAAITWTPRRIIRRHRPGRTGPGDQLGKEQDVRRKRDMNTESKFRQFRARSITSGR